MKRIATLLPLALLSASCSSTSKPGHSLPNTIGMTAIMTAYVAALPVMAVKKVYDDLSGVTAARDKSNAEQWQRRQQAEKSLADALDPYYETRIRIIQQRNPVDEAEKLIADNIYYIIPFGDKIPASYPAPYPATYPGLSQSEGYNTGIFDSDKATPTQNPLAAEIATSLTLEKTEVELDANKTGIWYMSATRDRFQAAVIEYKKQFNRTMYNAKYQAIYHATPPPPNPQKRF